MNWLSNFARPGLKKKADEEKRDTPDNLWIKDPLSGELVYRLTSEQWSGLSVVCKFALPAEPHQTPCNFQLLGLAFDPLCALKIATDFFNWDLEAHGQPWRLGVSDGTDS